MKRYRSLMLGCCLGAFVGLMVLDVRAAVAGAAAGSASEDLGPGLTEMPVLTGTVWRKMTSDEKVAFVWGIGHVVTIEWQSAKRAPSLTQVDFAAKMAEGLAGMSMNEIVGRIDAYYKDNPGDLEAPVVQVIWTTMVRPKLKTGIADLPLG